MPDARTGYEAQRAQIVNELKEIAPEPLATRLSAMIRPAIALETSPSTGELALLACKFGGAPDVPVGFEWPRFGGEPLAFVAQLNLELLAPFDVAGRLPKSGLLSFWMSGSWGTDFGDWRVCHFQSEEWHRLENPGQKRPEGFWPWLVWAGAIGSKQMEEFLPAPLEFHVFASFADHWSCMELYGKENEIKDERVALALGEAFSSCDHQMFGYPDSIQWDVRDECAAAWNDFLPSSQARDLGLAPDRDRTTWNDFELLLQISGDDNAKMEWGDAGTIYFLIRRADLEQKRFERCWFTFQCA